MSRDVVYVDYIQTSNSFLILTIFFKINIYILRFRVKKFSKAVKIVNIAV